MTPTEREGVSVTLSPPFACVGLLVAVLALAAAPQHDAEKKEDPAVALVPVRVPGNVFAAGDREFAFRVAVRRASKGRVVWRLAAGTATVKAGEVAFTAAPNAPAAVSIKIAVPPVKGGIVLRTTLAISVVEDRQTGPIATLERDLWVFPPDPFVGRSEWLKRLKITLYDPKGDTAKVLTAAKVPFEEAKDAEAVAAVREGVVIVGEGLSFKDAKGFGAALSELACGGVAVLVLAPAGGEVLIPGLGGPCSELGALSFRRDIVRDLDKRLDASGWPPDGRSVASSVTVKAGADTTVGAVKAGAEGWPWIEAHARAGKGRWALCGLGVIAKWDAGPTPRFLFVRMLEHLTDTGAERSTKESER